MFKVTEDLKSVFQLSNGWLPRGQRRGYTMINTVEGYNPSNGAFSEELKIDCSNFISSKFITPEFAKEYIANINKNRKTLSLSDLLFLDNLELTAKEKKDIGVDLVVGELARYNVKPFKDFIKDVDGEIKEHLDSIPKIEKQIIDLDEESKQYMGVLNKSKFEAIETQIIRLQSKIEEVRKTVKDVEAFKASQERDLKKYCLDRCERAEELIDLSIESFQKVVEA